MGFKRLALGACLFAGTACAQPGTMASLTVRAADGGWFSVSENQGGFPNPTSTIRKYLPDFRTVVWERLTEGYFPRELRVTPEGGVAFLGTYPGLRGTLRAWDRDGTLRFSTDLALTAPSATQIPIATFVVEAQGTILVASGTVSFTRLTLSNAYEISGGSLNLWRISAAGTILSHSALPIPTSSIAGVELDQSGTIFIAGATPSDNLPVSRGAVQVRRQSGTCSAGISFPSSFPCDSGFVARIDPKDLTITAATYLGGQFGNTFGALQVDANGNPIVVGTTSANSATATLIGEPVLNQPYPRTSGTVAPPVEGVGRPVATISRLSPNLDQLIDSTWLAGAAITAGRAVGMDSEGHVLLGGYTTTLLGAPYLAEWPGQCGPRKGQGSWGFVMRLSARFERIERVLQMDKVLSGRIAIDDTGRIALGDNLISPDTNVHCVISGASFDFADTLAAGQLAAVYGGPFAADEAVMIDGRSAPILSRSATSIQFVVPRDVAVGRADLIVGANPPQAIRIVAVLPAWKAALTPEGRLTERGSYLIEALLPDGSRNAEDRTFGPNDEVRAYATGVDISKPMRLFLRYPKEAEIAFTAQYVPDTADSVVEFRFTNPFPSLTPGGATMLSIQNDGIETPLNPGYIWSGLN